MNTYLDTRITGYFLRLKTAAKMKVFLCLMMFVIKPYSTANESTIKPPRISPESKISGESVEDLPSILEDWTFKYIIGHLETLKLFLNDAIVENEQLSHLHLKKIVEVVKMNSSSPMDDLETKLDVRARDEHGNENIVEVYRVHNVLDFKKFQMYASRAVVKAYSRSYKEEKQTSICALFPIVVVVVISEKQIPFKTNECVITVTSPENEDRCLLNYVYLDLSRAPNNPATNLQKWVHFLKKADGKSLFKREYENLYESNDGIKVALSNLRNISRDPELSLDLKLCEHFHDARDDSI